MKVACICRWVTGAEFRTIIALYMDICTTNPTTILDPEVCLGLATDPETWTPRVRDAAIETFLKAFQKPTTDFIGMVFRDEDPVGVIHVTLDSPCSATVHTFAMLPETWKSGLATQALEWLQSDLVLRGVGDIRVAINPHNLRAKAFLQDSQGFRPRAIIWVHDLPKNPPVRFEVGGTGGVSDFGEDPAKVVSLKPTRKPRAKKRKVSE